MKNLVIQWLILKIDETTAKNGRPAFSVDSPPKVRLEDELLFSDPSAAHDTLAFYCTMLGHEEIPVSVASIEN